MSGARHRTETVTPSIAADLFRGALWVALEVGGPLLAGMTVVAVIFGILQAATQVQDASISFTPKVAVTVAGMWLASTWMVSVLERFLQKAFVAIPWIVQR